MERNVVGDILVSRRRFADYANSGVPSIFLIFVNSCP